MEELRIKEEDYKNLLVASLPTRPTAPAAFGGKGYSAAELKEAFDKFPTFLANRFNLLLEYIDNGDILTLNNHQSGDNLAILLDDMRRAIDVILNHLGISV